MLEKDCFLHKIVAKKFAYVRNSFYLCGVKLYSMYTIEDLRKAFKAGEDLVNYELSEAEFSYKDNVDPGYHDFEGWFKQNYDIKSNIACEYKIRYIDVNNNDKI